MEPASGWLPSYLCNYAFCCRACCTDLETYLYQVQVFSVLTTEYLPWLDMPCCELEPSPGELLPITGLDRGGPDTGVPGFEPIGRGEFIMPPPGLDIGKEVAGELGLGLAPEGCWRPAG